MSLNNEQHMDAFTKYWRNTLSTLERYPASAELEVIPMRCTDFATMYGVRITSIGPYRLFGYLSIPNGNGPHPAIYYAGKYGSVLEPIPQGTSNYIRSRFITFSIGTRGQRNSDQPFSAMFPGLLTKDLHNYQNYIFRSIAADCVRGLEFLIANDNVDPTRVVAVGNDLSLIAASLHEGITHVVCTPDLFHKTMSRARKTSSYPLEEINDYLRLHTEKESAIENTLSYFELDLFACTVKSKTLLMAGPSGSDIDKHSLRSIELALQETVTIHESENSSYLDGLFSTKWITAECGFNEPILPSHWR